MPTDHEHEAERLIRQIEARVQVKDELRVTLRGLTATFLIVGAIVGALLVFLAGAILFAAAVETLGH